MSQLKRVENNAIQAITDQSMDIVIVANGKDMVILTDRTISFWQCNNYKVITKLEGGCWFHHL